MRDTASSWTRYQTRTVKTVYKPVRPRPEQLEFFERWDVVRGDKGDHPPFKCWEIPTYFVEFYNDLFLKNPHTAACVFVFASLAP